MVQTERKRAYDRERMQRKRARDKSNLCEAVKLLRPFAHLGDVILSEAPPNAFHAQLFTDSEGGVHMVALDHFRSTKAFLDSLCETK